MIFKCKMCGGDITLNEEKTYGTCECCGTTMTLPKSDDEQRIATFNRGNQFRRVGEFDKAVSLYEQLIRDNDADAEAHWCCALSRFGIEYVEDPTTFEYIPTCHRASYDNFLEDVDYLAAVEHSEGITRKHYQKEAVRISEIQKDILKTSQSENPFDVFICYKESDEKGQRTIDSTLAQDIYYQLTDVGFRVFFSRITLEDKVGSEYEPYIFAALNSAKVMVVIGTKPEHLNAIWVKNEWSRFLVLMKKDKQKLLIPCYRDMDPYDMPEALSVLQSYDMSKIGFIQDLIRGIKKVVNSNNNSVFVAEAPSQEERTDFSGVNISAMTKRAYILLEDGDFRMADEVANSILNQNPEYADAYVIKLLATKKVNSIEQLADCLQRFADDVNYKRAIKYADSYLENQLKKVQELCEKNFNQRRRKNRISIAIVTAATLIVVSICLYVFVLQYPIRYSMANRQFSEGHYEKAREMFQSLDKYKDSSDWVEKSMYAQASAYIDEGRLDEAKLIFEELISYNDSSNTALDVDYQMGKAYMSVEKYEEARAIFENLGEYSDAKEQLNEIEYIKANKTLDAGDFQEAYDMFQDLGAYKDSLKKVLTIREGHPDVVSVGDEISFGNYNGNTDWIILAREENKVLLLSKYVIDKLPYNNESEAVNWVGCSLREWLNKEYIAEAFDTDEEEKILTTDIINTDNQKYKTPAGKNTNDKVFLLSMEEVEKYLLNQEERIVKTIDGNFPCIWWVRNPGYTSKYAAYINKSGQIYPYGQEVSKTPYAYVRPAMWITVQ